MEITITRINDALIKQKPIYNLLNSFVEQNANPRDSPNLSLSLRDDLDPLSRLLLNSSGKILLPLLQTFKILLRKEQNRTSLPPLVLKSILSILKDDTSNSPIRTACSNVLLNATFERDNVLCLLSHNGVNILLNMLRSSSDPNEKISLAGALQSICFIPEGRDKMRELKAESLFVKLLVSSSSSSCIKFISRISGVLHNLSVDSRSSSLIRESGGIQPIVNLLKYISHPSIVVSSAGALQNLAR